MNMEENIIGDDEDGRLAGVSKTLYIKLGRADEFADDCIRGATIRIGYRESSHEACLAGRWDEVHKAWMELGKKKGAASDFVRQITEFYEADESVLWVTFYRQQMWWCRTQGGVTLLGDGSKCRATTPWSSMTLDEAPLDMYRLSGGLTKTAAYRGTICEIKRERVLRRISGRKAKFENDALAARLALRVSLEAAIKALTSSDFEVLVDLVFRNAGFMRVGAVGSVQKTLDLDLVQPLTLRRALVQVKSRTSAKQLAEYAERFVGLPYDEFYFVYHTAPAKGLPETDGIRLMGPEELADAAIDAGLMQWLLDKAG